MRKLKLFMAALALTGWGNFVLAQTDVTSTYITNPSFESDGSKTASKGALTMTGWIQSDPTNSFNDTGFYNASTNLPTQGTVTVTPSDGDYLLFFRKGWAQSSYDFTTSEAKSLPSGVYTLSVDYKMVEGYDNTQNNNSAVTISAISGETTLGSKTGNTKTNVSGGNAYTYLNTANWSTVTANFTLTETTSTNFVITLKAGGQRRTDFVIDNVKLTWTDILQGAKDALQAEIDKAKLCDAKEGLADAIAAAESTLTNATTVAELETALATLQAADKDAVLRYENGLADATYAAPVTTSFVVNGTFTDNVNGWTCTGGFQNRNRASNQSGAFTVPFFENWNGDPKANKMYQTISNIPNGTYRLDIAAFVNTLANPNESQYVFANNDKTYLTTGEPTAYEVYTVVTNNQIEIGLEQTTATANWMGIDNVSLRYYGAGDVINDAKNASHKLAWEEAKAAAEAAIANAVYANVTGSEKTALEAEIAKTEPTTADGYDEAAAALNAATATFTAAKPNYDIFSTYNTELQYADASKKPAITNESTAASITTALRAYYESNAKAEGVTGAKDYSSAIAAANADTNTGWTNGVGTNNNQGYTDSEGTVAAKYLDGGWASNAACNVDMTRTVEVPAGTYLLTVKARGAVELTEYTLSIAGKTINLPHSNGDSNGVFGNGWEDASIEFESDGKAQTLEVIAKSTANQQWFSMNDFRLVQLKFYSDAYASTTADYADMNTAITNAEAMTLGFEVGEYAPYVNANALKALAEAKAMDQTAVNTNLKNTIASLVEAMNNRTANTAEVNAVNTALFTSGDVTGTGWTQTQTWGQVKEDVYSTSNGTFTYGEVAGFEMPLKANTVYKLTFNHRAWDGNNAENGGTVSVLCGEDGLAATSFTGQGTNTTPKTETFYFKTGAAGNYVFTLNATSGRPTFGGVTILKAVAEDITISEDATAAPTASEYANVTLKRGFNKGWNAVCLPFATPAFDGAEIAEFTGETVNGDNVTLNFEKKTAFEANKPYLVYFPATVEGGKVFEGVAVAPASEVKAEGTAFDFMGTYTVKDIDAGNWVVSGGALKKASGTISLKPTRTYFTPKTTSSNARIAGFTIDGNVVTGISTIFTDEANTTEGIYNLQGQKVNGKAQKGIYIVNGKKVIK